MPAADNLRRVLRRRAWRPRAVLRGFWVRAPDRLALSGQSVHYDPGWLAEKLLVARPGAV